VSAALGRAFADARLREVLSGGGLATAAAYDRAASGERLEAFFARLAERRGERRKSHRPRAVAA
jgi:hypothetical protein